MRQRVDASGCEPVGAAWVVASGCKRWACGYMPGSWGVAGATAAAAALCSRYRTKASKRVPRPPSAPSPPLARSPDSPAQQLASVSLPKMPVLPVWSKPSAIKNQLGLVDLKKEKADTLVSTVAARAGPAALVPPAGTVVLTGVTASKPGRKARQAWKYSLQVHSSQTKTNFSTSLRTKCPLPAGSLANTAHVFVTFQLTS